MSHQSLPRLAGVAVHQRDHKLEEQAEVVVALEGVSVRLQTPPTDNHPHDDRSVLEETDVVGESRHSKGRNPDPDT